jgi:alcohol dehydrogenase YqhD (iron-dependent ADH family)
MGNAKELHTDQSGVRQGERAAGGQLIAQLGCKKGARALRCGGSARRSGLLERIEQALAAEGVAYVELGGVVPNPRLSKVNEGIALCKKEGVDFLLAVGGGSVIDSCKAIGYGVANGGDVWDFYSFVRQPTACLPIRRGADHCGGGQRDERFLPVITHEDGWIKRGYSS